MLPRVLDGKRHGIERKPRAGVKRLTGQDLKALRDTPPWEWPTNAAQSSLEILIDNSAREGDRLIATRLAGDFTVINDELSAALMGIVSSAGQPEDLRAAAAISLGPVLEHADTSDFDDPYDDIPIAEHTFHRIQLTLHRLYLDAASR